MDNYDKLYAELNFQIKNYDEIQDPSSAEIIKQGVMLRNLIEKYIVNDDKKLSETKIDDESKDDEDNNMHEVLSELYRIIQSMVYVKGLGYTKENRIDPNVGNIGYGILNKNDKEVTNNLGFIIHIMPDTASTPGVIKFVDFCKNRHKNFKFVTEDIDLNCEMIQPIGKPERRCIIC